MQAIYAIVWAIIFGFAANYLTNSSSTIFVILGYLAWVMCGLSTLTLFRMIGR